MDRRETLRYIPPLGGELTPFALSSNPLNLPSKDESSPIKKEGKTNKPKLETYIVSGIIGAINLIASIRRGDIEALSLELIAKQQPHHPPITIEAPENEGTFPHGVIFEANSQSPRLSQESQETEVGLPDQALIILDETADEAAMQETIERIETDGGKIVHVFPPHILIGSLPRGQEAVLLRQANIQSIHRQEVDPETIKPHGLLAQQAVEVWNTTFVNPEPPSVSAEGVGEPLVNDVFVAPDLPPKEGLQATDQQTPDYYQTSKFMIGPVAVGIILPESDGIFDPSIEDWTSEEQVKVFGKIVTAMGWWAVREPKADLSFYYDFRSRVPTGYEPINRSHSDQGLWIGQVMEKLGYSASSYFTRVRDYNNALRNQYQTDWAFTIFVVDSSNDGDNKFSDGYFAYAYLGGPFMVMTYGNNGYGSGNMDAVTAHEAGHIFRALDQYYSAHQACTYRSGHLRVENQNSQYGSCLSNEPSIMRGLVGPYWSGAVDFYARGQVGWWDLDGDNVLDPVDPDIKRVYLYPYVPDPLVNPIGNITYRGLAVSRPYAVASVDLRVDSGPWQPGGIAANESLDEMVEPFEFVFDASGVERGKRVFQARLTDANGIVQIEPFGSDELTVLRPSIWLPIITRNYQ